jgi:hypothetical protein
VYRPVPIYLFFGIKLRPILVHDVITDVELLIHANI